MCPCPVAPVVHSIYFPRSWIGPGWVTWCPTSSSIVKARAGAGGAFRWDCKTRGKNLVVIRRGFFCSIVFGLNLHLHLFVRYPILCAGQIQDCVVLFFPHPYMWRDGKLTNSVVEVCFVWMKHHRQIYRIPHRKWTFAPRPYEVPKFQDVLGASVVAPAWRHLGMTERKNCGCLEVRTVDFGDLLKVYVVWWHDIFIEIQLMFDRSKRANTSSYCRMNFFVSLTSLRYCVSVSLSPMELQIRLDPKVWSPNWTGIEAVLQQISGLLGAPAFNYTHMIIPAVRVSI